MALGILYCINTKGASFAGKVSCLSGMRVFFWNWKTGGIVRKIVDNIKKKIYRVKFSLNIFIMFSVIQDLWHYYCTICIWYAYSLSYLKTFVYERALENFK